MHESGRHSMAAHQQPSLLSLPGRTALKGPLFLLLLLVLILSSRPTAATMPAFQGTHPGALHASSASASEAAAAASASTAEGMVASAAPLEGVVLVSGATGRTGSLLYSALGHAGFIARALVRNLTKARELLGCSACDEAEGIFLGDVTAPETLGRAMTGVRSLVILTSSYPLKDENGSYYFPPGEFPRDIDWIGSNNQVRAALAAGVQHVLLVSSMGTTQPDTFLDKLGDGHALFYKLNGETDLMASGIPSFTIVKPGGLLSTPGGKSRLLAGHNDGLPRPRVTRADVAAVLLAALMHPDWAADLRFDLSSDAELPASGDFKALFDDARAWGRDTGARAA